MPEFILKLSRFIGCHRFVAARHAWVNMKERMPRSGRVPRPSRNYLSDNIWWKLILLICLMYVYRWQFYHQQFGLSDLERQWKHVQHCLTRKHESSQRTTANTRQSLPGSPGKPGSPSSPCWPGSPGWPGGPLAPCIGTLVRCGNVPSSCLQVISSSHTLSSISLLSLKSLSLSSFACCNSLSFCFAFNSDIRCLLFCGTDSAALCRLSREPSDVTAHSARTNNVFSITRMLCLLVAHEGDLMVELTSDQILPLPNHGLEIQNEIRVNKKLSKCIGNQTMQHDWTSVRVLCECYFAHQVTLLFSNKHRAYIQ